jgi:hypothetical protein
MIAGVASGVAAVVVPMIWERGTVFAAAATPVIVAVVSEMLKRPVEAVSAVRVRRTPSGTAILDPPEPPPRAPDEPFDPLAPVPVEELEVLGDEPPTRRQVHRRRRGGLTGRQWKLALATGLVAFLVAAAVVTASELTLFGDSVSSGDRRTTFFGGNSGAEEPTRRGGAHSHARRHPDGRAGGDPRPAGGDPGARGRDAHAGPHRAAGGAHRHAAAGGHTGTGAGRGRAARALSRPCQTAGGMAKDRIPTSRLARSARVTRLAAGQAARQLGTQATNVGRSEEGRRAALERRHLEAAEQIVAALGTMKGAAMKLGQVMSFLDVGLVPEEHREEFQRKLGELRDAAPSVRFEDMRKVVEAELEEPLEEAFAEFEEEPIAAASIGQVYRARLHDGRAVAVKVQYPGVAQAVRADMQNLGMILRLM